MAGTIIPASPLITRLEKQSLGYTGVSLTNFDNSSSPQIVGDFEIAGSIGAFASADSISGWSALSNGTVYVKVVPNTGAGTVAAEYTSVAPVWSDVKQGWYGVGANANHRYLFSLVKTGASGYTDKRTLNKTSESNISNYKTNQDLRTTDPATFTTLNTGQGNNELYAMDQNVRTNDDVDFASVKPFNGRTFQRSGSVTASSIYNDFSPYLSIERPKVMASGCIVLADTSSELIVSSVERISDLAIRIYGYNITTNTPASLLVFRGEQVVRSNGYSISIGVNIT